MSGGVQQQTSPGGQGPVEGISDLLRCYICMETLRNATVCPHCSQVCCFPCLRRWCTDNRSNCPHCRNALSLQELKQIPLFDELRKVLEDLKANKKEDITRTTEQEKCSIHHEKMSVYCETCKTSICHECALWSDEHKEHSFKQLDVIFKRNMQILQGELTKLKDRLKDIVIQVQQVEKKIEGVKISKSKTRKELAHAVEKMLQHVDESAKDRIVTLNDVRKYLRSQAMEITKQSHDLEKSIAEGDISPLIDSNGALKPDIDATIKKLLTPSRQLENLPKTSQFINEVVPEYDSAVFKISSFHEKQRKGEEVYSEPLEVQGLVWRLKVYPNGHKDEMGNYLAVFVELAEGYSTVNSYQYCIEMLYGCTTKFPSRNHLKEYASEFADGESWGYRKYYDLSRLQTDGFLKDDTLMLKFSVRAPTYYQKYQDQSHFLKKMGKERDALRQKLEAAKQQISTLKTENKALLAERQHASSRTVPSQHDSRTMPLHSSQQLPQQQHHSGSHHHQHRERSNRLDPEDARGYVSQPPSAQLCSPSHAMRMHSSPKRSPRYTHGETFQSSSQLYQKRRRSNEEASDQLLVAEPNSERRRVEAATSHSQDPQSYRNKHGHGVQRELPRFKPHSKASNRGFVETTGVDYSEASSSQQWEDAINPADISFALESGDSTKSRSSSSGSTLIESDSPPREPKLMGSQEPFEDDDGKDMISLAPGPIPIPLSNFPHYYESPSYFGDHQQENCLPMSSSSSSKLEQGLSQPFLSSPPKSRYGKSLTDLTGSNISLTSSSQQFLSQSAVDIQHMQEPYRCSDHSRHAGETRRKHEQRFRTPRGQLQKMSSDPHLNKTHIPGLQAAMSSALSNVTEEEEQRRQQKKTASHYISQHAHQRVQQRTTPARNSLLQQRHLKATMVRGQEEVTMPNTSPHKNRDRVQKLSPASKNKTLKPSLQEQLLSQQELSPPQEEAEEPRPSQDSPEASPSVKRKAENAVKRSMTQRESPKIASGQLESGFKSSSTNNLSLIL